MTQATGIFTMRAEAYHADPCETPSLSSSIAHLLCSKSPRHAWTAHPKLNPDYEEKQSSRFDVGTVAHALFLERRDPLDVVKIVHANDWRTKIAQEERDAAREDGKIPLLAHQTEEVMAMLAATREQLDALEVDVPLFEAGRPEQTLIWEERGVTCRAMLDWLRNDGATVDDLKTTSASADPKVWGKRTMFAIGADVQAAFHLRGLQATTELRRESTMRYVVQETFPPYALGVVTPGADVLAVANAKIDYALKRWAACLETDTWPGYSTEVEVSELPAWADDARWLIDEEVAA